MINLTQAGAIADMWNTFKIDFIEDLLHDEVEFSTDWVLLPVKGKNEVVNFLQKKLRTMRNAFVEYDHSCFANLMTHPKFEKEVFVRLLCQTKDRSTNEVFLKVDVADEKIKTIRFMALDETEKNQFSTFSNE